ncbi:hypothetical protein [Luteibacter sp. CQ10]|uniref:hypothetical protein n=1 Tax=Luteibacter sp. CQ10 TaxID=2805821 RepID=UPI0034A3F04C
MLTTRPSANSLCRLRKLALSASALSITACTGTLTASRPNPALTGLGNGQVSGEISPKDSTRLCEANFDDETNFVGGTNSIYSTWTLTPLGEESREAMGRLKAFVSSIPEAKMISEKYYGSRASMDIELSGASFMRPMYVDIVKIPDFRPLPVRVEFDAEMGATSFVLRSLAKQQGYRDRLKFAACSMLSVVAKGALAEPIDKKAKRPRLVNPFKKPIDESDDRMRLKKDGMEMLMSRATNAGKAVVLMPTVQLHGKYPESLNQLREERLVSYWMDLMGTVTWRRTGTETRVLEAGNTTSMKERGLAGHIFRYPDGKKSQYQFFIVDPGTYDLVGASTDLRRAPMPDMTGRSWSEKVSLGKMSLRATQDTEYYQSTEWQDAKFQTRSYPQSYCQLVHVSGNCVGYGYTTQSVTEQVEAAGYKQVRRDRQVSGLRLTMDLAKPFASFTVAGGEVAVIDGFALDGSSGTINPNACKQSDDGVAVCAMRSFSLLRIPAKMEHIRYWQDNPLIGPAASGLLTKAKPVEVSVTSSATLKPEKPGTFEAGWARRYVLKADR